MYNRNEDLDYKKIVKNVFQIEDISLENIKKYIIQELFDDEYENNINEVENFLKTNELIISKDTNWLGSGMYFWDNLSNAKYWKNCPDAGFWLQSDLQQQPQ